MPTFEQKNLTPEPTLEPTLEPTVGPSTVTTRFAIFLQNATELSIFEELILISTICSSFLQIVTHLWK